MPKWLNEWQGISTTSGDFLKRPILARVCAEQVQFLIHPECILLYNIDKQACVQKVQ
jgi:hypothetical protein